MFAGHADQIGLIVTHINENGYIYTNTIGGWDPQQLIGQRMTIHTAKGPIPAVIARKAIHLLDQDERKSRREAQGAVARHRREGSARRPRRPSQIGDPVTLELRLPGDAQQPGQLARHGRQDRPVGGDRSAAAGAEARRARRSRCTPSRRCRRKSASAARSPAPTASIRTSASRSTSRTRPIARRSTRRKKATSSSAAAR